MRFESERPGHRQQHHPESAPVGVGVARRETPGRHHLSMTLSRVLTDYVASEIKGFFVNWWVRFTSADVGVGTVVGKSRTETTL